MPRQFKSCGMIVPLHGKGHIGHNHEHGDGQYVQAYRGAESAISVEAVAEKRVIVIHVITPAE